VSNFAAAAHSLLDNEDVVSYLQELDATADFEPERLSAIRTNAPQFRAEIAALGEGMLDHDATHHQTEIAARFEPRDTLTPGEDEAPADDADTTMAGATRLTGLRTALYLLGMSLLGASSAAVVFHDRVVRILGW
jgi:hypothetical protein